MKKQVQPSQIKKRGRPATGFDKAAYMKEYMRKRRAKQLPSKAKAIINQEHGEQHE